MKYRRAGGVVADIKRIGEFDSEIADLNYPVFAPSWEDFVQASDSSSSSSTKRLTSKSSSSNPAPVRSVNPYAFAKAGAPKATMPALVLKGKPKEASRRFAGLSSGSEEFKPERGYSRDSKLHGTRGYVVAGEMYFGPVSEAETYDSSSSFDREDDITVGSGLFAHCIECDDTHQMTEIRSWTCSKCKSFNLIE